MQTVTINLEIAEIIYDIQNKTYLTGKSRNDGKNHEQVANMQANDDEENANQILRSISTAFSNLKTKLGEYLDLKLNVGSNELITAKDSLQLTMQMPSNYNLSTLETIVAAAHQYIVSMAVRDWFLITHKVDSAEYSALADISLSIITEAINKRKRPMRKQTT